MLVFRSSEKLWKSDLSDYLRKLVGIPNIRWGIRFIEPGPLTFSEIFAAQGSSTKASVEEKKIRL